MSPDSLSVTFAALADPTRRAILARLASGETTVTELAGPFDMSLPAVTKHLKVLQRAGLITQGRQAQWRPCRLQPKPLREVADYAEQYRRLWEHNLDRLGGYLQEITAQTGAPPGVSKRATKSAVKPSLKKITRKATEKNHVRKK
jgi:DNA-binding transcriptional ArsR family regulator